MKQETKFETYDGVEVAASPLLRAERTNAYGSVPGLDDEELLDAAEILGVDVDSGDTKQEILDAIYAE